MNTLLPTNSLVVDSNGYYPSPKGIPVPATTIRVSVERPNKATITVEASFDDAETWEPLYSKEKIESPQYSKALHLHEPQRIRIRVTNYTTHFRLRLEKE